jgi:hypothetical protein
MKTFSHLWHLAEIFLEWEMLQIKVAEEIKTQILCSIIFFSKNRAVWDNVEKCGGAREATDGYIIKRMSFECWKTKATHTLRICNT